MDNPTSNTSSYDFALEIMRICEQDDLTIIDAIVAYCQENDIEDIQDVVEILHPNVINRIEADALDRRMIKGTRLKKLF